MRIARPLTFLLESIAIGVGVLFLGGSALADSSPSTAENTTVTITSDSSSTVIIDDQSTSTASQGQASEDASAPVAQNNTNSDAAQTPLQSLAVSETTPTALPGEVLVPSSATSEPSANTAPTQQADNSISQSARLGGFVSSISLRSDLASAKYSNLSMPFLQSLITPNDLSDYSVPPAANMPAKVPTPSPAPVQPLGMVSAILSLFSEAVPGVFQHSFALGANGFTELLIVLTMVALAVAMTARTTVVSYGTWLKQTGFTSVARSGLPAPFSSFAIPSMMGYVSAPAPYA